MANNIDISKYSVEDFFIEYKSLQIPYYQREYRWEKEEVNELIDDIYNNSNNEYFLGSFIISRNHSETEVVDGQQRITTLLLIYVAIASICNEENIFMNTKYFSMSNGENRNMEGLIANPCYFAEYSLSHYNKNLTIIKNKLEKLDIKVFKEQLEKVVISRISLPVEIDKISFFSQINSTGRELTNAELIKSYIFTIGHTNVGIIKQKLDFILNAIPNDRHDDFYRHFIAYKTGNLENKKGKKIFKEFKGLFSPEVFEMFFDELFIFGVWYKFLHDENSILNKYPLLKRSFDSYCVLLIEILIQNSKIINYENLTIDRNNLEKSFNFVEGYKFRRLLLEMPDKVITRSIPKICLQIREHNNTLEGLIKAFYIDANSDNVGYRMPKYNEIKDAFNRLDMYNKNSKNTYAILEKIERSYGTEVVDLEKFSIEHILPQNYSKWNTQDIGDDISIIQQIGNLTLSTIKDNSEMSNSTFIEKRKLLEERSYLHMNKEIFKLEAWNYKTIQQRNKSIFNRCMDIWKFDDAKYEEIPLDVIKETTNIGKYKKNHYTTSQYVRANDYKLENIEQNYEPRTHKKHNVINIPIRNKKIKLSYSKNATLIPRVQELLDSYDGQYSTRHAHIAAKELEYILLKNTDKISLIRDYCIQEININADTQRVSKLKKLFAKNEDLYYDLGYQLSELFEVVDTFENIDLTDMVNLESLCANLKELPIFQMINISFSNGAMTAFMGNMKSR